MALPQLTEEERKAALEKAIQVRQARSAVKNKLATGELSLADILAKRLEHVEGGIRIGQLLTKIDGIGARKKEKILADLKIPQERKLSGLGKTQVERLLAWYDDYQKAHGK